MSWALVSLLVVGSTDLRQTIPIPAAARLEYRLEPLPKDERDLEERFTPAQIGILEKLNRRDRGHLLRTEPPVPGLVVPAAWPSEELAFSPMPADYPWAQAVPKAIVVYQPMQAFGAYEFGRLVRWGPVSTGRKDTPTPIGIFNLTWKAKQRRSTDNEQWLLRWYFNFVNARGVSFHEFDLPGYPASHACVRMLQRDAEWLYSWGEQWKLDSDRRKVAVPGSLVLIIGRAQPDAPWTSLDVVQRPIPLPPLPAWFLMPVLPFAG